MTSIWRHLHLTILQCWADFSNVLAGWSFRMIRVKKFETVSQLSHNHHYHYYNDNDEDPYSPYGLHGMCHSIKVYIIHFLSNAILLRVLCADVPLWLSRCDCLLSSAGRCSIWTDDNACACSLQIEWEVNRWVRCASMGGPYLPWGVRYWVAAALGNARTHDLLNKRCHAAHTYAVNSLNTIRYDRKMNA